MKMLNRSSTSKLSETTRGTPRTKADWSIDKRSKPLEMQGGESWTWWTAMRFMERINLKTLILMYKRRRLLTFQTREEAEALEIPRYQSEKAYRMRS